MITSKDGVIWDKEANYFYYQHGPLARTELGDQKVQAMDYAYTIQGWIKGVNSNTLKETRDIGQDGETTSTNLNQHVGRDAYGYSLNYFSGDYASITTISDNFIASTAANTGLATDAPNLYNGNIKSMVTAINDLTTPSAPVVSPQLTAYKYDQLNRIKQMKAYRDVNLSTNAWGSGSSYDGSYQTALMYDANGNIERLQRNGVAATNLYMDDLEYKYETVAAGYTRNTNKLRFVDDNASYNSNYNTDVDQQTTNNYVYDELGNLISDTQEEIDNISWTVYGKIKSITRTGGSSKPNLEFLYDASGNRTAKIVKPQATVGDATTWTTTFYMRDAQGNVMSTYDKTGTAFTLKEQMLYGSSRLGTLTRDIDLVTYTADDVVSRTVGKKAFELSNHLGSVLSVVSDRKIPRDDNSNGVIDYFLADVISTTDYYPFGSPMPGRTFSSGSYKYGFNGKENDNEVKGNGNQQDYGMRIYGSVI